MTFHLAAYDSTSSGSETILTPVTDMVLPTSSNGFLLPRPMMIIAAFATTASGDAAISRALISAPSLARVGNPYIRPIAHGETTDPNVMNLISNPLKLPASENVSVGVVLASGVHVNALLWFCEQIVPVPPGEKFTMRFTGAATSAPASASWVPVGTINFDGSLPPGEYTVVGFEHWSPNSVAARLIFPGSTMRPGTLSVNGNTFSPARRTDRIFYEGGIGVYGSFNAFAPPMLEVLTNGADSAHEGYLTLIRTGDMAGQSSYPGSGASAGARTPLR
ncbi:MAG: hypothetical protein U0359_20705 [Byssovorax sp.]